MEEVEGIDEEVEFKVSNTREGGGMTMRKTRKENKVSEGGGRRGADKVTTRRKTRRRREDEYHDVFLATALQSNVAAPPNCGCEFRSTSKPLHSLAA